jgi:hypothetical protein
MILAYPITMGTFFPVGYLIQWGVSLTHATFVSFEQNVDTVQNISCQGRSTKNKVYTIPN